MKHYILIDKKTKPGFGFLIKASMTYGYYLYDSFNDALDKAKELSHERRQVITIFEPSFNCDSREWRLKPTFVSYFPGKIIYDPHAIVGLHAKFYTDSGEWLNADDNDLTNYKNKANKEGDKNDK